MFAAALSLAGAVWFLRPAFQRHQMAAADTEDPMTFGPDWHKPAHPWSQVESAQVSRREGLKAATKRGGWIAGTCSGKAKQMTRGSRRTRRSSPRWRGSSRSQRRSRGSTRRSIRGCSWVARVRAGRDSRRRIDRTDHLPRNRAGGPAIGGHNETKGLSMTGSIRWVPECRTT